MTFSLHLKNRGGGAVGYSVRLASGRLGVRIPAATDLSSNKKCFRNKTSMPPMVQNSGVSSL